MSPKPSQPNRTESSTQGNSPDAVEMLDVLGDETCRKILRSADGESTTVSELAAECGVSESTVYRRLSDLGELGLVEPANWPVADEGNAYRTALDTMTVTLQDSEFSLTPNDGRDLDTVIDTLESMVDVEHASFDRESRRVQLELTVSNELFEFLLSRDY